MLAGLKNEPWPTKMSEYILILDKPAANTLVISGLFIRSHCSFAHSCH